MAEPIVLTTRHQLGVKAVKQRIDERFVSLKSNDTLAKAADIQMVWNGDTADVSAKALGQTLRGSIAVTEHDLTITVHLPALLVPFRAAIATFIESQKDTVKAEPNAHP